MPAHTPKPPEELFDLVDECGHVIGFAPRSRCHRDPALIHQSVHVQVFDEHGRLFLQRRSMKKDTQPGKWDSSVGGHFERGEHPEHAARREMLEELGARPHAIRLAYWYLWRADHESELVRTFLTRHDGPFVLSPTEIEEGRFWAFDEIRAQLESGIFSPQFVAEFPRLTAHIADRGLPTP